MNDETVESTGLVVSLSRLVYQRRIIIYCRRSSSPNSFFSCFLVFHNSSLVINQDLRPSLIFLDR